MPDNLNPSVEVEEVKKKGYPDEWDMESRRIGMTEAEYKPFGSTDAAGCANCNWFISPDSCSLVYGDISPTGSCKLWMKTPEYTPKPMPVTIVKGSEEGFMDKLFTRLKEFFTPAPKEEPVHKEYKNKPMSFFKDNDGNTRFFAVYSNNFKDKQGEIISGLAHKEFIAYCDRSLVYPELWLWHAGKQSRWGQVDMLDYCDGFTVASGIVDVGKEYIVEALEKEDIGVSHGFYALMDGNVIKAYRSFEISPLPADKAANYWTNFTTEDNMPFSDAKKTWLKDVAKVSDETVTEWETSLDSLSKELKTLGIEYKETDSDPEKITEIATLTQTVLDLAKAVVEMKGIVVEASKSIDDKVADVFKAEIAKLPQGFTATESKDNVVGQKKEDNEDYSWFAGVVKEVMK